jgi:hypothetical protein
MENNTKKCPICHKPYEDVKDYPNMIIYKHDKHSNCSAVYKDVKENNK